MILVKQKGIILVCIYSLIRGYSSITPLSKDGLFSISYDDHLSSVGVKVSYNPQKLFSELKLMSNQLGTYKKLLDLTSTKLKSIVPLTEEVEQGGVTYERLTLTSDHLIGPWADYQVYLIKGADSANFKYLCETVVKGILPTPTSVDQVEILKNLLVKYDVSKQIVDVSFRRSDLIATNGMSVLDELVLKDRNKLFLSNDKPNANDRNVFDEELDPAKEFDAVYTINALIAVLTDQGLFEFKSPLAEFKPSGLCLRKYNVKEFTPTFRDKEVDRQTGLNDVLTKLSASVSGLVETNVESGNTDPNFPIPDSLFNMYSCLSFNKLKSAISGENNCIETMKSALADVKTLGRLNKFQSPDIVLGNTLFKKAQLINGIISATAFESTKFIGDLYLVGDLSRFPYILSGEGTCYGTPYRPKFTSGSYVMEHLNVLDIQCCYEVSNDKELNSCPKSERSVYDLFLDFYKNDHGSLVFLIGSCVALFIIYGIVVHALARFLYSRCNTDMFEYARYLVRRRYIPPMNNENNNDVQMDLIPLPALR